MSTNEIKNIQQLALKKNEEKKPQELKEKQIEVFGSSDVSAKVDLTPDENNSLFNKTTYFHSQQAENTNPEIIPMKITELPENMKDKYEGKDKEALTALSEKEIEQAAKLSETKLSGKNIAAIVKMFEPEQIDTIKTQVLDMQKEAGGEENVYGISFGNDSYDKNAYNIKCLSFDYTLRSEVLDKDLNIRSIEQLTQKETEDGKKFRVKDANDLKTRTFSKVQYDFDPKTKGYIASYELRSKINEDGTMISREYSKPSKINGVFDIDVLTKNGTKNVSETNVKKNGKVVIQKNMESLDGTKTKYQYKDTPNGDRYLKCKITTSDGKVLMNNTRTFKVISENEFKSTFNDKSHTIKIENDVLTVTDDKDSTKTASFSFDKIEGDKESMIKTLKSMSGEELIALNQSTKTLVGIDSVLESYYSPKDKSIHTGDNLFVMLHELGHAKDFKNVDGSNMLAYMETIDSKLSNDKELQETFEAEKTAFNKEFPGAQREHIDYFINTLSHYGGPTGGIQEAVAEGNAINATPKTHELLGIRTQYLQQYYPRTMARLNDLFSQDRPALERTERKLPLLKIPETKKPELKIPKG